MLGTAMYALCMTQRGGAPPEGAGTPSEAGPSGRFHRFVAVLATGVLVLVLVGSGSPGSAGAVQPVSGDPSADLASAIAGASIDGGGSAASPLASPTGSGLAAAANPTPARPGGGAGAGPMDWPSHTPSPARLYGQQPIPTAALQARLDAILAKYRLPGVSATIIWPDGRMWTGTSGWADVGRRIPVVSGTAFSVGSVSKTFLAALVLQLVHEKRLSLDDTVRHWLPGSTKVSTLVTVRQLLNHTSGLYDFFENTKIDAAILAHPAQAWTPAMSLSYVKKAYCDPGTCWVYSNTNYLLLGQIVERVTGRTTTALLRERFFDPLGLNRTFAQGVEPRAGTVATSYKLTGTVATRRTTSLADGTAMSPFTSVVTAAGAAGDIAASSVDLARWARALYGGAVLAPQSLAQMMDTSASTRLHAPTPYGFAFSAITLGERLTYGHNGRLIGARASIRYLPQTGFTIAVVTNQDIIGPDVFGTSLMNLAIASVTPLPPVPTAPGAGGGAILPGMQPSASPGAAAAGASGAPGTSAKPTPTPTLAPPPELQDLLGSPSPGP